MASNNLMVGLEIGTSKICVVVGESRTDGTVKILGVGQAPSRGVRKGEIVDFETAMKCVHEAVVDAEQKSDVMIRSVYVAVAGSHLQSFNNRGCVMLPEDRDEIDEQDVEDVKSNAVKELPLEVEDVVFSALASAQVVLTKNQKDLGALVIDMGGGTTDYVLYTDGAIRQSGCLAIGGDHITNDISMGLRIPMARAEKLKIEEGSCILGNCLPGDMILLKDDSGFAGKEIERETLNTIIHLRLRETLELLKRRLDEESYLNYLGGGIFITGGCSLLNGLDYLAGEIFELPAQVVHAHTTSGLTSAVENPQFSTAIGLIKYAQAVQRDRRPRRFGRIFGKFFSGIR